MVRNRTNRVSEPSVAGFRLTLCQARPRRRRRARRERARRGGRWSTSRGSSKLATRPARSVGCSGVVMGACWRSAGITSNDLCAWLLYALRMFDSTRLRVFREVVERGSFSAAAEALSFTQPAVSRQIATLEREAGTQLLQRMPRGIRLTEAGRILLGHTEAILGRMVAAQTQIDAVARLEAGRLRIGSFSTANATVVPRAIAAFSREHPEVGLSLTEGTSSSLIPRLRAGELDVALATDPPEHELEDLVAAELVED